MYKTNWASHLYSDAGIPFVHGGEGATGGGLLGVLDGLLDRLNHFFEPGNAVTLLPGIQGLGLNQHPLIVHFPIAFLFTFFLLELIGSLTGKRHVRDVASWMLYLGAVFAALAAGAGLLAAEIVMHGDTVHDILEWHERLGLTVAGLAIVLAVWRAAVRARFSLMGQALHLLLAAVMATCLFFAADLGGLMVYQHGVGVKQVQQADEHHHHHAD